MPEQPEEVASMNESEPAAALKRNPLRPRTLATFIGQADLRKRLTVYIDAHKQRGEALAHVLLSGPPGLGKTTLANIIADEMGVPFVTTSGPAIEKPGDIARLFVSADERAVVFIDEIHRMKRHLQECVYSAMEDFAIDVTIEDDGDTRTMRIPLKPFTLVGATTREGLLDAPFRARFGIQEKLQPYTVDEMQAIIERTAGILDAEIEPDALEFLAPCFRGTPRVANHAISRIRDLAQVEKSPITLELAEKGLAMVGLDCYGLTQTDRALLNFLATHRKRAHSLKTLAAALNESEQTIEDAYEPYLVEQGYILRTSRGRRITNRGLVALHEHRTDQ